MRMCAIFGTKTAHLPWTKFFGYKPLLLLSSTYGSFHWAKFKINLTMEPELWWCTIFRSKVVYLPLIIFFFFSENLLMSLVSFIHACLLAKNRSQILSYQWNTDDLRTLKSHWLRAIFAFTWELDFSQARSFLRTLMNHENFDFTQIPGKTNNMIFLKSSKNTFLGHFWPFLPDRDFFQKIQLSHTTIYGPLTLC